MPGTRPARPRLLSSLLAASVFLAAACGGGGGDGGESPPPTGPSPSPDDEVSRIEVTPSDTAAEAPDGEVQLEATALTAGGEAVAGVTFQWSSSDPSVAEVDADGLVTALAAGTAEISASAEGETGRADVEVLAAGTPTVDAVSPTPLPEGGTAALSGDDFSATASENAVTVDGAPAEVLAASPAELEIRVPTYDCLPAREVEVRVTVDGKESLPASAELEPDEAPVELAAGGFELRRDPTAFCLQLAGTEASEIYLVGVQSTLEARPHDLTAARIAATAAAGGSGAASRAPGRIGLRGSGAGLETVSGPPAGPGPDRFGSGSARPGDGGSGGTLRAGGALPLREPARQVGPGVGEGDTVELLVPGPGCRDSTPVRAAARSVGEHVVFLGDVQNPEAGYTAADLDSLTVLFDDFVHPTVTDHLGEPTDLDDNGRTVFLVSKVLNEQGRAGFVRFGDLLPEPRCTANGGEFVYLPAPDPEGTFGRARTREEALAQDRRGLPHEFAHVVQGRRNQTDVDPMPHWMGEGQAILAEEVTAHAVTGREARQNYGPDVAFVEPGGTRWYANPFATMDEYLGGDGAPRRCTWLSQVRPFPDDPCERSPSAGMGWTFLRWVTDHFGPDHPGGPEGLQRALIDNDVTGLANVADVTGEPVAELVARWAATLYMDDRPSAPDALSFPSWNLRAILSDPSPPFGGDGVDFRPPERGFASFEETVRMRPASAAYFLLSGDGRPATAVKVRSEVGGEAPDHLQVWVVRVE